jgi:5-methylcytosine-specific restriction protein A
MYETELVFGGLIGAWILYEIYGRTALEWLTNYTLYIRIAGGVAVLGYLYWQARASPEGFTDSLETAKTLLTSSALGSATGGTREKRNVTGAMKKKVGADYSWKCATCKDTLDEGYQVDHIVPLFAGGSNDLSNLQPLCAKCHAKKSFNERL